MTLREHRRTAVGFWEHRRLFYNLALLPPAAFGYVPRASICASVGDMPLLSGRVVFLLLAASALAANICYTFAYVLEFFLGCGDAGAPWNSRGRQLAFFGGTALAMLLAFFAAFGVADAQFPENAAR